MEISAGEFKAKCLKLMDEVVRTHEPLVITKRGRPVVRIMPVGDREQAGSLGYMAGAATIHGDIVAPLEATWEAMDKAVEPTK